MGRCTKRLGTEAAFAPKPVGIKSRDKKTKKQWNEDHRRITVARDVYESWRKIKCMCVYSSDTAFAQHLLSLEM